MRTTLPLAVAVALASSTGARADAPPETPAPAPPPAPATLNVMGVSVKVTGYIEAYYQLNLNWPSNLITAYRGFDNRASSFTIQNAVLDVTGTYGPVSTRIALQVGAAPASYYLAEPNLPATAGVGSSGPQLWQLVQQLLIGYQIPVGKGLLGEAGVFLSPIGVEALAVKDSWNFSRSDLFYALPYYHSGLRFTYVFNENWTAVLMAVNGWNDIVNTNFYPCFSGLAVYTLPDRFTIGVLYFGGVEDPIGSPEGQPWRNLWDVNFVWNPLSWLAFEGEGDTGFEHNNFGVSSWAAAAGYVRFQLRPWLFLAGRGDYFHEAVASDSNGTASKLFFPAPNVASETATVEFRLFDHLSMRVEYRHDSADAPMYFSGQVAVVNGTPQLTAETQNTVTFGATSWF